MHRYPCLFTLTFYGFWIHLGNNTDWKKNVLSSCVNNFICTNCCLLKQVLLHFQFQIHFALSFEDWGLKLFWSCQFFYIKFQKKIFFFCSSKLWRRQGLKTWLAAMGFGLLSLLLKTNRLAIFIDIQKWQCHYLESNFKKIIYNILLANARKRKKKKHAALLLKMYVPVNEKHYPAASVGFFPLVKVVGFCFLFFCFF